MGADLKAVEEAMGAISLFFVHTRDFTRPSVPATLEWLLAKYSLETQHLLWKQCQATEMLPDKEGMIDGLLKLFDENLYPFPTVLCPYRLYLEAKG